MQALRNFRTWFFRGTAALLPTILTIWIFVQCYLFIQNNISRHINRGIVRLTVITFEWLPPLSEEQKINFLLEKEPGLQGDPIAIARRIQQKDLIDEARIHALEQVLVDGPWQFVGFIIALIGVCFVGAFLASFVGKSFWHFMEKSIANLPVIRQVYRPLRQITDFLLTKKDLSFNKVVAIQYPRSGVWSIGLATGSGIRKIVESHNREFLTVFVPTSPTPFTGYVIMTPKDETIELNMTIDEALRFTISGGVITPAESDAFVDFTEQKDENENIDG